MGTISTLKRLVGADQTADYECRSCGASFGVRHYTCPQCGSYSVERPAELDAE